MKNSTVGVLISTVNKNNVVVKDWLYIDHNFINRGGTVMDLINDFLVYCLESKNKSFEVLEYFNLPNLSTIEDTDPNTELLDYIIHDCLVYGDIARAAFKLYTIDYRYALHNSYLATVTDLHQWCLHYMIDNNVNVNVKKFTENLIDVYYINNVYIIFKQR